jgi:DNA topoisomerase-6 subunit A
VAKKRRITKTLFESPFNEPRDGFKQSKLTYNLALQTLADSEDARFDELELASFSQIVEHEVFLYESRGLLKGPLKVSVGESQIDCMEHEISIPTFVEHDFFSVVESNAAGVLLVENQKVFKVLVDGSFCQRIPFLIVTGCGIPRSTCRRLLHRLERDHDLKIHVLTDNDTWGYFIYSVLARGMLGPHAAFDCFSVTDPRYIGLRAGVATETAAGEIAMRPWKEHWDLRIAAMRSYPCFSDPDWQLEFDAFEQQGGAIDLLAFISELGIETFIDSCLKNWLAQW